MQPGLSLYKKKGYYQVLKIVLARKDKKQISCVNRPRQESNLESLEGSVAEDRNLAP
jgi:hypothetical protein